MDNKFKLKILNAKTEIYCVWNETSVGKINIASATDGVSKVKCVVHLREFGILMTIL